MASTTISATPAGDSDPPKRTGLARAAGIVMAATLLSRLLGMVRDIVIAHQLGAGVETDAYTAAFKVPDLLMYLVAGGALSSTFIPVFKEYLHQNKEKRAWQTFSIVATVTVVLATGFVIFAEIFTPWFVRLLNPGYDQARIDLTVPLTRIVLPAQIFFMLGGLLMGTLNARGQFLIPALGPSIYNIGIIFGAAVLYPLGMGLDGLMWGALLGAFIGNFAMQIAYVARAGMRYRPSLAIFHPGAVKVWKMMGPILLGVSLPNVDQIINSYFASELPTIGAQASMQFAVRLMLIPIGIFAQAMGIAILPTMASQAAAGQYRDFKATTNQALRTILFITVPASALLFFLLAAPIVTFLLQSGKFEHHGTLMTSSALRFYSLGIFAWSAQAVLTRGFYALQDSRTPVISGTVMTVLFICMNWMVVNASDLGVGGLALATSIAAILHMAVMFVLLRHRLGGLQDGMLARSIIQTLLATAALSAVVLLLRDGLYHFFPAALLTKMPALVILFVSGGAGILAYGVTARGLRMPELASTLGMIGDGHEGKFMDIFERFNTKFGKWYEGLFGGEAGELRPKDVLRKITTAIEDNRKEGFDNKIYVPNKYVLELAVGDTEERDYLLSFLDEEELVSVLQRFMAQNHYHARGPLDFTIAEVPEAERAERHEKLRVKVRFEKGEMAPTPQPPPPILGEGGSEGEDLATVLGFVPDDEPGTIPAVAWASLALTAPDGRKSHFSLTRPTVTIGRSRNAGNDLVLDSDGMVSKSHARLERERDGHWTLYDLGSTNGTKINGLRVDGNRVLTDGDQMIIGATTIVFQEGGREDAVPPPAREPMLGAPRRARLVAVNGEEHVLASETLLGRAVTCDIVLYDPNVATKHARIIAPDAATYYLEDLDSVGGTWLNGRRLTPHERTLLTDGDRLRFGSQDLRFDRSALMVALLGLLHYLFLALLALLILYVLSVMRRNMD